MDQQLIDIIDRLSDSEGRAEIGVNVGTTFGELTIGSGEAAVKYLVKPLNELYGQGPGRDNVDPQDEEQIQLSLRMALSLNDYSRQDVKQAIRKILKSVDRHTKAAGQRGYLDFIHKYIKG
ncbi:MAG: hypothetical protein ACHRHE_20895 [Tepidisphaerales bacterium]